jgi:hypothetical protein
MGSDLNWTDPALEEAFNIYILGKVVDIELKERRKL